MTSEHQDPSRRKHRRNSGGEPEEPSKRRKHRHHHRHHRHSSRKDEENESNREDETKVEQEDEGAKFLHPDSIPVDPASNASWRPDYDMEEGEIVEDGDLSCRRAEIEDRKRNSDAESGEIKAIEVSVDCDKQAATGVCEGQVEIDSSSSWIVERNSYVRKSNKTTMTLREDEWVTDAPIGRDKSDSWSNPISDRNFNGDKVHESSKLNNNHNAARSLSTERSNEKSQYANEIEIRSNNITLPSENSGQRLKNSPNTSLIEKRHNEVGSSKRSTSRDCVRERSRSRSVSRGASHMQPEQRDLLYYADKKQSRDSVEERMSRYNRDYRDGSQDLLRDKEREHSSSHRHHSWEIREKDRDSDRGRERERDRENTREREIERQREKRRSGRDTREKESDRIGRNNRYYDDVDDRRGDRDRSRRLDEIDYRDRLGKIDEQKVHSSRNYHLAEKEKHRREEVEQDDYQEKIVLQLAEQEEEDVNRIKEESRRRRQAIIEKYKTQELQQRRESPLQDTFNVNKKQSSQPPATEYIDQEEAAKKTGEDVISFSVGKCSLRNGIPAIEITTGTRALGDVISFSVGKSPLRNGIPAIEITTGTRALGEGTPKSERSDDMFCDDIFGESPAGVRKLERGDGLAIERSGLHDNWDDAEGYYSYRFGEILDARYEVIAAHGKGVFSTVVRARDIKAGPNAPEVAIKIIRNNDTMYKAGLEELVMLKKLVGADPEDKRHCVRFLSSFKYRNHLCLVFESLHMNLREVLKKFGRNIGLSLIAVQVYAKQLFTALKHLRNCGVLHCDIKPDNMLVNNANNVLKLCDFGNAMFAGKNEITPYLVSRFYRAPEIILGLPYDHPMDIWSVGCCLFELYTGKVLFPGPSNNDMLRLHMELKGPFPKKMLRKGLFTEKHFDQDLHFLATEEHLVTKKTIKRLILNIKPKDIGSIVSSSPGEDPKMLINFKDLLEKIFVLDPDKRITVSQALSHPFITNNCAFHLSFLSPCRLRALDIFMGVIEVGIWSN